MLVRLFFEANLPVIYFAYGLVFFLMGFSAALGARIFKASRLAVARALPWLAGFGALVGLSEWGVVFIPLQSVYLPETWLDGLHVLHSAVMVGAHLCLLSFGLQLTVIGDRHRRLLMLTALGIGVIGVGLGRHTASHLIAAYGLGLPGAALSARGILLARGEIVDAYPHSARWLLIAAWTFILSVPLGPLAMPVPGGRPAMLLGVPVEVPLAFGGLVLAWSLLYGLEVLHLEHARRLERAERREAVLEERHRLAKALNDGVIQDLFAAGMLMGAVRLDLPSEQFKVLGTAQEQMQGAVERLRAFIMELDAEPTADAVRRPKAEHDRPENSRSSIW